MILKLSNDINQLKRLEGFVDRIASKENICRPTAQLINLALEEAVSNVINYSGCTWVKITAYTIDNSVYIDITDDGIEFNPCNHADKTPAEQWIPGGLGITLIRNIMDTIKYDRYNHRNRLSLTKQLPISA